MAIVHIVLLKFKSSHDATAILDTCNMFLELQTKAVRAQTGEPYIQNITGGKNTSTEGFNADLTHAFTVIFGSAEDLEYYVKEDQAHAAFAEHLRPVIEKIVVVDYEPQSF